MKESKDERILVFARGRDGDLTRLVLAGVGLDCTVCGSPDELCREMETAAGVLIVAEESLTLPNAARIVECLRGQPPWSDLPVIVVAGKAGKIGRALKTLDLMGNVSVLPRPLPIETLLTAVQTSLRARRRQYEVRNLLRDREEAARRKDEFLAMLAHELRNPLAPIRSAVHVLRLLDLPDSDLVEMRDILDRQVGHMARLIDDLLDVSRISRGKIELQKQVVNLGNAAAQAAVAVKPLMDSKGHDFSIALAEEPIAIEVDPTSLEQVITNVLNNAAKYTDPGGRVSLFVEREGPMGVVRVKDTGIGIEAGVLPRIFDLFTQSDRSLDRKEGGLGIGLTVVKGLVEQHGGMVEARSAGVGQGTEIVLRFPAVRHPAAHGPMADGAPGAGRGVFRVLVVEDNLDAATMLARFFRLQGHEVRVVYDGSSALDLAPEFRPHIILSDIGLPGMDGYQVARRLRREPTCRAALLLALTGYGQKDDVSRAKEAGFDHHLTKPLDLGRLDTILTSFRPMDHPTSAPLGAIAS